ncbi:nuclease-related domain-containing protein [Streptomyces sp. NBC_01766]|uniref:nuclease-related domain-containing protein n=1 Tax=Streptomyces sp. NBC_01766 TaxID=2975936 RepID=UPI002DD7D3EE|nr:nuclease-related domain-containing protein [Streptomyces sp. NBC_01766]WSC22742.1 NERD domain-containing protein [Streptomyces sp. NBC_01766]
MGELVVKPWRRGGKYRLYVNRAGDRGEAVAWYDCLTGEVHHLVDGYAEAALAKIKEWAGANGTVKPVPSPKGATPSTPIRPSASVPALSPLTSEDDLALNAPGAALLDMARAKEREHSRLVRFASRLTGGSLVPEPIRVGLEGERVVGAALRHLPGPNWHVVHGVQWATGADIDHVVVGPSGVFTVNAKHHVDASIWVGDVMLRVNGGSTDYLRNSLSEARRTAKLLRRWCGTDIPVQPVLAVVGAHSIKVDAKALPVLVLDGSQIADVLVKAPAVLSPGQIASTFAVVRHRQVWLSTARKSSP